MGMPMAAPQVVVSAAPPPTAAPAANEEMNLEEMVGNARKVVQFFLPYKKLIGVAGAFGPPAFPGRPDGRRVAGDVAAATPPDRDRAVDLVPDCLVHAHPRNAPADTTAGSAGPRAATGDRDDRAPAAAVGVHDRVQPPDARGDGRYRFVEGKVEVTA